MRTLIKNVKIILPDRVLPDAWLVTEGELIDDFGSGSFPKGDFGTVVDGEGLFLSPGFVART